MSIKADLTQLLRGHGPLSALLDTAGSVWHRRAPSSAGFPRIIFYRIADVGNHIVSGPSAMNTPVYTFDVLANTAEAADAVGDVLDALLNGFTGVLGSKWCSGCSRRDRRDSDFTVTAGGEHRRYMVSADYAVGWKERVA